MRHIDRGVWGFVQKGEAIMGIQAKGRHSLLSVALASSVLAFSSAVSAEEMDHSQHAQMDHSQHAQMDHSDHQMDHSQMDHSTAAQASEHMHHSHGAGQWMFEYRYMSMNMEDLLDGSDRVSSEDVSGIVMPNNGCMMSKDPTRPYCMAPTEMTMNMHMLMAMYGFSDKLSGMVMFNYLDNEMDMVMHMRMMAGGPVVNSMTTDMETSGIGDTQIGAMYTIDNAWTAALSLSIPTGEIDEKVTMMGMEMQAPYGMQLGTGTYDLIPAITYKASAGQWTYGGQAEYRLHLSENDNDYTWGDKLEVSAYGKYAITSGVQLGGRLEYLDQDKIDGQDPDIMPIMSTATDPDNYGGTRLDLGLDVTAQVGAHTFGAGYAKPIQQDVNGIQLETQSIWTLSYMYMM
ncbi:MAG: transporter [Gammaproteobacteria bacterium]